MTCEIEELLCRAADALALQRHGAARRLYRRAERLSRQADLPRLRALAAEGLANVARRDRRFSEALASTEVAIEAWGQAGEPIQEAAALLERAESLERMDRWPEARLAYRKARAALLEQGCSSDVSRCDNAIAVLGDRIARQIRDERRAAGATPSSRRLFGRPWSR